MRNVIHVAAMHEGRLAAVCGAGEEAAAFSMTPRLATCPECRARCPDEAARDGRWTRRRRAPAPPG
jgi:hypothetical protein